MAVVEEIVVVIFYLIVGWTLDIKSRTVHQRPIESRPWKGNGSSSRNSPSSGTSPTDGTRTGRYSYRQGPIHSLVGMAMAARQERQENRVNDESV